MDNTITNTALVVRFLTESSALFLNCFTSFKSWCFNALGPLLLYLAAAGLLSLLVVEKYFEMEDRRCERVFGRKERARNNEMKRRAVWELVVVVSLSEDIQVDCQTLDPAV